MTIAPAVATASLRATSAAAPIKGGFAAVVRRLATPPTSPAPQSAPRLALQAVDRARERLDAVLAAARRGQTFTAPELLALQADAYRYSQTLEVASKVTEQAVQSVKQAVNTQV